MKQNSNVPAFLTKLWTLVEDSDTNEFICWSQVNKISPTERASLAELGSASTWLCMVWNELASYSSYVCLVLDACVD